MESIVKMENSPQISDAPPLISLSLSLSLSHPHPHRREIMQVESRMSIK
jgi:hypothetical protein